MASPDPTRSAGAGGTADRAVRAWLLTLWGFVLLMVVVGGVTRLTGSGLSMVEWRPLMGAVPPLDDAAWNAVFDRYKQSPQYAQVNHWMALEDFKRIFFWEYVHRLLGRTIGLVFLLPFAYFLLKRRLQGELRWKTFVAFALGGLQGLLGWVMVQSGLVDQPRVSHFRLAAHLLLAFGVGQWLLWLWLDLGRKPPAAEPWSPALKRAFAATMMLTVLQIVYGAFMAGARAGYLFRTFPDMNGHYMPAALRLHESLLQDLLHGPPLIHWVHRWLGTTLIFVVLYLVYRLAARPEGDPSQRAGRWVFGALTIQFTLGVLTVTLGMPLAVAVAHQAGAYLLLSSLVTLWHRGRQHAEAR